MEHDRKPPHDSSPAREPGERGDGHGAASPASRGRHDILESEDSSAFWPEVDGMLTGDFSADLLPKAGDYKLGAITGPFEPDADLGVISPPVPGPPGPPESDPAGPGTAPNGGGAAAGPPATAPSGPATSLDDTGLPGAPPSGPGFPAPPSGPAFPGAPPSGPAFPGAPPSGPAAGPGGPGVVPGPGGTGIGDVGPGTAPDGVGGQVAGHAGGGAAVPSGGASGGGRAGRGVFELPDDPAAFDLTDTTVGTAAAADPLGGLEADDITIDNPGPPLAEALESAAKRGAHDIDPDQLGFNVVGDDDPGFGAFIPQLDQGPFAASDPSPVAKVADPGNRLFDSPPASNVPSVSTQSSRLFDEVGDLPSVSSEADGGRLFPPRAEPKTEALPIDLTTELRLSTQAAAPPVALQRSTVVDPTQGAPVGSSFLEAETQGSAGPSYSPAISLEQADQSARPPGSPRAPDKPRGPARRDVLLDLVDRQWFTGALVASVAVVVGVLGWIVFLRSAGDGSEQIVASPSTTIDVSGADGESEAGAPASTEATTTTTLATSTESSEPVTTTTNGTVSTTRPPTTAPTTAPTTSTVPPTSASTTTAPPSSTTTTDPSSTTTTTDPSSTTTTTDPSSTTDPTTGTTDPSSTTEDTPVSNPSTPAP